MALAIGETELVAAAVFDSSRRAHGFESRAAIIARFAEGRFPTPRDCRPLCFDNRQSVT